MFFFFYRKEQKILAIRLLLLWFRPFFVFFRRKKYHYVYPGIPSYTVPYGIVLFSLWQSFLWKRHNIAVRRASLSVEGIPAWEIPFGGNEGWIRHLVRKKNFQAGENRHDTCYGFPAEELMIVFRLSLLLIFPKLRKNCLINRIM